MPSLAFAVRRALSVLSPTLLLGLVLPACRDSKGGPQGVRLVPSSLGANGCSGPDQTFAPPQTPTAVPLATLVPGPFSQLAAAGDSETLFATGAGATLVQIDVSGALPVETELLSAGEVDQLLAGAGIAAAAELSGLCVLDAGTLLAVEHASNTILAVDRSGVGAPAFFAGMPSSVGGFADGLALGVPGAGQARFHFDGPTALLATDASVGFVLVADTGNHAVRRIGQGFVGTLAGSGAPFFADGDLSGAGFDSPVGLTLTCSGTLLVSESGAAGVGGHRLRQIVLGPATFFGQAGTVITRAGNGTDATLQGDGVAASLSGPVAVLSTADQDTYWIDSESGILRRMRGAADASDCPLWSDCATAVTAGGDFTPGGVLSLAQTPAGVLYVLDADAGTLLRVTP
jgi:hypothetical protein